MSFETQISSNTFTIDTSSNEISLDKHFHKASAQILKEGHPRKVVFGQMQLQQRSVYQIVSPYVASIAKTTGGIALQAGSLAYGYIRQGFWWFYDQITNKVIPYTRQQIPKLIFIVAKSAKGQKSIKSGEFCVLEMQDEDYKQIARKQRQNEGPIKVLIPLGNKDEALIQEIKKNYQVSYSFPIQDISSDEQSMSITYCIPSESYEILENEAKEALREEKSREINVIELMEQEKREMLKNKEEEYVYQTPEKFLSEKLERRRLSEDEDWQQVRISSIRQQCTIRQKPKPKAIFLPDACCFIYQQEHQLYPMLKEGLERDANAVAGHLINSENYKQRYSKDSFEDEAPMIKIEQKIGKNIQIRHEVVVEVDHYIGRKMVDMERKVRLQVGRNSGTNEVKREDKEVQLN